MDNKTEVYFKYNFNLNKTTGLFTIDYNNALTTELVDVLQKHNIYPNLIINPQFKLSTEILSRFNSDNLIVDLSNERYKNSELDVLLTLKQEYDFQPEIILIPDLLSKELNLGDLKEKGIEIILTIADENGKPSLNADGLIVIPFSKNQKFNQQNKAIHFLHYVPKTDCDNDFEDELLKQINQLNFDKIKFVTFSEINTWWKIKNKMDIKINSSIKNKIEFRVFNGNSIEVNDLQIFINLKNNVDLNNLTVTSNNILVDYELQKTSGELLINLKTMLPNSNRVFIITFVDE